MKYNKDDAIACLPAGTYEASIEQAVETKSKSGNEMVVIVFKVYTPSGRESTLKDYVVNPTGLWRLKKLAKAIGKLAEFESGVFRESDYVGANLRLDLEVEEDEQYGDKNRIKAWVSLSGGQPTVTQSDINAALGGKPPTDDEVPF